MNQTNTSPIELFKNWYEQADRPIQFFPKFILDKLPEGLRLKNAVSLSTVDENSKPNCRIVLFKDLYQNGFSFYTNYQSQKGQEIHLKNEAAMVFFWRLSFKQIRIRGQVEKLPTAVSDAYWNSRPRGSQLAGALSGQSQKIENYETLKKQYNEIEKKYHNQKIPRPNFWGGYVLHPIEIEFWNGKPNRLHERRNFTKNQNGTWSMEYLAP
jgi:pyridoxamine 5'-phosphate oxidase